MIEFFMPMQPPEVTAQEHKVMVRNGKPVFYDPPELKTARQKLTDHLAVHKPDLKLQGPLTLHVKWCFQSDRKAWRITKPDTDNLDKLLKDCMTHVGFWNDDAQVCQEIIEKFWVDTIPGIWIRLEELE